MATYDVGGRSAIVTGAGSGIGHAIARLLAANGAAVLVTDINEVSVKAVVDEIHAAGGTAASLVGDVTDQEFAERCVAAAGELGPLRIAVNNAGVGGPLALVGEYPLDSWRRVIETNQNAVFYGLRAQLPAIAAAEGGGAIVNIASILGSVGIAYNAAYVTAKHAIVGLTKNAALEYAAQGVRVHAVGPGFISTPLIDANLDEETQASIASSTPSDGSAHRTRLPRWRSSWPPTPHPSSPAATTWSTEATPLCEGPVPGPDPERAAAELPICAARCPTLPTGPAL